MEALRRTGSSNSQEGENMYLYIKDAVMYETPRGAWIFLVDQDKKLKIEKNAETVLSFCNGLRKEKEIINTIFHQMGVSHQEAEELYRKIRKAFSEKGVLHYSNTPKEYPVVYRPRVLDPPFEKAYLELIYHDPTCKNGHHTNGEGLSVDEWKDAIDELFDCGCLNLSLTGEPLLHEGFFEIVNHAREKPLAISVYTNGLLPDRKTAHRMKKTGVSSVCFSVDGPTAAIHDEFKRVTGSFDKTVAAIKTAQSEGLQTKITMHIHRDNLNKGKVLKTLMDTLGVTEYTFAPVIKSLREENYAITPAEYAGFLESFSRNKTIQIAQPHVKPCNMGYTECVIHFDGTVGLCPPFDIHGPPLGDLTTDLFFDVWNSPFLQRLRRFDALTCGECEKCPHVCSWLDRCIARTYYMGEVVTCGGFYGVGCHRLYQIEALRKKETL